MRQSTTAKKEVYDQIRSFFMLIAPRPENSSDANELLHRNGRCMNQMCKDLASSAFVRCLTRVKLKLTACEAEMDGLPHPWKNLSLCRLVGDVQHISLPLACS